MAILYELNQDDVYVMIYKIDHKSEYYIQGIDFTDFDQTEFDAISNPMRKKQWLASRYWLKKISQQQRTLFLRKTDLGRPHITNHTANFSISHSKDIIAIIWSEKRNVAIDIEHFQEKIIKIKSKFIHPQDLKHEDHVELLTLIWSAKESIYKYYHTKELYSFKETIAIKSKTDSEVNYAIEVNQKTNRILSYKKFEDYLVTWID